MEDRASRLDKSIINDRYEDLRSEALQPYAGMESGRSQGFGVFSLQGMIGWLQAWSRCTIPVASEKEKSEDCMQQNLPVNLRGQVAILLASVHPEMGYFDYSCHSCESRNPINTARYRFPFSRK